MFLRRKGASMPKNKGYKNPVIHQKHKDDNGRNKKNKQWLKARRRLRKKILDR